MKSLSLYILALAAFLSFALFSSYSNEAPERPKNSKAKTAGKGLPQVIHPISIDKQYNFAGEAVPLDNFDAKERLDKELLRNAYYHSSTILNIKRATRFFPTIERILAEENVPDDLKYLAVAESSLMNAVSPAGAKGFWQFMKGTARDYKLEVSNEVDERYDLEKSTRAACRYLKKYKERFGSWTLAAAAYNMGGGKLSSEMKNQKAKSYYDLNISAETMAYVFRIIALKDIMQNPEQFGFSIDAADKYYPLDQYTEMEIKEAIPSLGEFANKYGISYRMLKIYNPWLRASSLTNKQKKTYRIRIPK